MFKIVVLVACFAIAFSAPGSSTKLTVWRWLILLGLMPLVLGSVKKREALDEMKSYKRETPHVNEKEEIPKGEDNKTEALTSDKKDEDLEAKEICEEYSDPVMSDANKEIDDKIKDNIPVSAESISVQKRETSEDTESDNRGTGHQIEEKENNENEDNKNSSDEQDKDSKAKEEGNGNDKDETEDGLYEEENNYNVETPYNLMYLIPDSGMYIYPPYAWLYPEEEYDLSNLYIK